MSSQNRSPFGLIISACLTAAAVVAVAGLISAATVVVAPKTAQATPQYAAETKLPCGRCHVNPAGGGPRTAFGNAFAKNDHKLPAKSK